MKYCYLLFLCIVSFSGFSQQNYWQQEVNYTINVTLDDRKHELRGEERIEYINKSPDNLTFIYFHLWPNAYKNNTTAFAKQQLINNKRDFQFAPDSVRGFIDNLEFKVNGQPVKVEPDSENIDIVKLILNEPLRSGQRLEITTPFRVKLPASFSRLGHVGQSYQITQWYPKPAVYDRKGWHPMPYLDQGEFYSEFGRFDVSITLPENYTVASTGVLQNQNEQRRLDSLAVSIADKKIFNQSDDRFPPSARKTKTLRYVQDNIHDFGWFADKRFNVLKDEVELPHSKRKVTTWLMFLNRDAATWIRSMKDIKEAVYQYSLWVGDYPYAHATAVDGALSAGAGMEYPMVTVTDPPAIIHEVGHNWFYGILASNERRHPWLDEGINSYYEFRIGQISNKNYSQLEFLVTNKDRLKNYRLYNIHSTALNLLMYQMAASRGLDQPIDFPAEAYSYANYGSIVYMKTGVMMQYLANYLTQARFDSCMKTYFERWKFKHPYPEDLQTVFEEVSGEKLDWFFRDIIKTTKTVDAALTDISTLSEGHRVTVKNKTSILAPVPVAGRDLDGRIVEVKWTKPGLAEQQLSFTNKGIQTLVADPGYFLPELNRTNNQIKVSGTFKKLETPRLQFLVGVEQFDRQQLHFVPAGGYNTYDKVMFGGALYNSSLFQQKLSFLAMPLYSMGQNQMRGLGFIHLNLLPRRAIHTFNVGYNFRRFERYQKHEPALNFTFKKPRRTSLEQTLKLAYTHINNKNFILDDTGMPREAGWQKYSIPWLRYNIGKKNALQEMGAQLDLDVYPAGLYKFDQELQNKYLPTARLTLNYGRYYNKNKQISARFFAGGIFNNNNNFNNDIFLGLGHSLDYKREAIFLDRSRLNNNLQAFVRQTDGGDGGFRNYIPVYSQKWLTTINLDANIPKVPLTAYLDLGTAYQAEQLFYGTGLSVSLVKDYIQIYLPVAGSNYAQDIPENFDDFKNNIRLLLRFNELNPFRLVADVVR